MLDELYVWLESYSGTSYDFAESFEEIQGDTAFVNPSDWRYGIEMIVSQMNDACDIIDKHKTAIPETMQNNVVCKRELTQTVINGIKRNIDEVCNRMLISHRRISTIDECSVMVVAIFELIDMIVDTDTSDIMAAFDKHEEENDNSFYELLNITRDDMTQLSLNVGSIRQFVFDKMAEEDEVEDLY